VHHRREPITAAGAPAAIGPYVHAIRSGGLLFCSGQIGLDPDSGELVEGGAGVQVTRCLENLEAVCAAAGATLADAVRLTVYVTDIGAFAEVNEAYERVLGAAPPARAVVGVAALPKGAAVEVDAIVALPDA
jgi:2-iminobutanoate/2-iminopropanoate deaminase